MCEDRRSVGGRRSGTAGRIENSRVAVYLAYSTPLGHAAIDRELYLPRSWTEDTARCRAAGIPDSGAFATKPALAARMIGRALDAGVLASWVARDEVYGGNPHLRTELENRQVGYVLAIACDHQITTRAGKFRADALARKLPKRAWQKLSAGAGAKGHRFYDWALANLADDRPGHHQLLVRRNRRTGELAFYRCYSPVRVPPATLMRVAGRRWTVEETFQSGKGLAGLDEHQVRRWPSWHRWVTLSMLAHVFLTVVRADEHTVQLATPPPGPIPSQPLSATSRSGMKIAIYSWSTNPIGCLIVEAHGIPLAAITTGGNRNDVTQLIPLIQAVPSIRGKGGQPLRRPEHLYADRGHDHEAYRDKIRRFQITPHLARRGTRHGSGLGVYRWVVGGAIALLHWFRRLRIRWEMRDDIHHAFVTLGCAVICWRRLRRTALC